MIECPQVQKRSVRFHYDLSTPFYRLLWGEHIHHGLWSADESPRTAQLRLTEHVAELAHVEPHSRVLDVGCGMGGSSLYLARHRDCEVTGLTISRLQRRWAACSAWCRRLRKRARFLHADAERVEFEPESFDVVWSIECTEHLFDKSRFFRRASEWLRPGGCVAICAWLEGPAVESEADRRVVMDVCEGFFCPSLGSATDYCSWMERAGLEVTHVVDWTDQVARTWDICERRVRRSGVARLARWIDRDTLRFLQRFRTIRDAYSRRVMEYGCFVARKPDASDRDESRPGKGEHQWNGQPCD